MSYRHRVLAGISALVALVVIAMGLEYLEHERLWLNCISDRFPVALSGGQAQCARAKSWLIASPAGYRTKNGDQVHLMCPPKAHGFIRRWSYGVTESGVKALILGPGRIYPYASCWNFLFDPTCGSSSL